MKVCVTGHDSSGMAVFSYVGGPTREFGPDSYDIWSTKGANLVPDTTDAEAPASVGYFPLPGETAFKFVSIAPQVGEDSEQVDVPAEVLNEVFEADNPGMHTSDTIDYLYIVSGQADLELDEGRKERVGAGDCVVQRGTRHAWRVIGSEPLVMCAVLLGAERIRRQPRGVNRSMRPAFRITGNELRPSAGRPSRIQA